MNDEPTLDELQRLWYELMRYYEEQGIVDSVTKDLMVDVKAKLDGLQDTK